jgi:uncharacterized protein YodC (DUF2158 family)
VPYQPKFNVGNIVQLKSDGPDMTVEHVPDRATASYRCHWFAGKKLESGLFHEDTLRPAKTEGK